MNKKSLRKYYLQKRNELKNLNKELKIIDNFLNLSSFKRASSLFITIPVRNEIDTVPIINEALRQKKRVFLPKSNLKSNELDLVEIFEYPGDLKRGAYGIPEPVGKVIKEVNPEITVVPGLAFTIDGYRLGYGGGYYDKFLEKNDTYSVGLTYDELLTSRLPIEPHDYPVDSIITPKHIIQTNRNLSQI